ncbi:MAG: dipicolinate synthase subunit B [Clostridiales bacterium]|nr:dipicolinate synthase subunit B [Clostridiales bacterium]
MCGSFCTFDPALEALARIKTKYHDITPVMSETAYTTDTRFGAAAHFAGRMESICEKPIIHTITGAEPFGPGALLDILVVAPCTGNTISKMAYGITDSSVTMAAKAHVRNNRPVLIAISTNDALTGSAPALGMLLNRKNVWFVPFYQDDPVKKPASLVADFDLLEPAIGAALEGRQLQPLLRG